MNHFLVIDVFAIGVWALVVFIVFALGFLIIINSKKDD